METLPLPSGSTAHYALFTISNAAALRTRLVAASQLAADEEGNAERAKLDFAFIDASMITSRLHLLTAISQALLAQSDNTLKTKTVHSEVLFYLEPGTNINDSLKHFGLSPSTTSLLLVHLAPSEDAGGPEADEVLPRMEAIVEGEVQSLDLLGALPQGGTNYKALRKLYKLNQDAVLAGVEAGSEAERQAVDGLVIGAVALKIVT